MSGRYKLLRPLGQGSQAYVWVAEHLALGSQVAVKLIDPELAKQEDARERFAREATAAAKLRSAHVVQILDHGIEGEQPFIVMELLEGEDLFDRIERRGRLTAQETSRIVTQVARALMRAHAEGIIHRDLKPENVFLVRNEDDELAKVLDFGVAKVMTPAKAVMVRTGVGTLIGTPHYMSPEQVKGVTEIDHRSDLWSLGVIAYQCVTGQLPFDSEGVGDLLIRITMNEPPKPSASRSDLPPGFDDWFKKACAKEPEDRFQSSREMADALAKAIGVTAPPSQSGRLLVSLADSPDLDWGSLAGVRIPMPPKRSAPPIPSAARRAETIDQTDLVEVTDEAPPSSRARPQLVITETPPPSPRASVPGPPPSLRVAVASSGLSENPFLNPAPLQVTNADAPPPSRRALQTTVTGLASSSKSIPPDIPPEMDSSRRQRATWYVALGVLVAGVAVTVGVIQSRGGFDALTGASKPAPAPSERPAAVATSAPAPTQTATAAPSGSSSSGVMDVNVTKKPPATARPVNTNAGVPRPKPTQDEITYEIPTPQSPKNPLPAIPLPR